MQTSSLKPVVRLENNLAEIVNRRPTKVIKIYELSKHDSRGGGPRVGTLIFSHIRRLGPFFWVQNSEFQYFLGFSEK